jgi:uncharacterized protein
MKRHNSFPETPNLVFQNVPGHIGICEGGCDPYLPPSQIAHYALNMKRQKNTAYILNDFLLPVLVKRNYYAILGNFTNFSVLNQSALALANLFQKAQRIEDIEALYQDVVISNTLHQMIEAGILLPKGEPIPTPNPNLLEAWINVTQNCNLNCDYCYLNHEKKHMSLDVGKKVIDTIFEEAMYNGYERVLIKYAGGEPLLQFPLVKKLQKYAIELAEKNDVILNGFVVTNGTLLNRSILASIKSLELRLVISMDGLGKYHDSQRHFPDGSGSFKAVERGVDLAIEYELDPYILVTVSSKNINGLPALTDWILDRKLFFNFNFYRENNLSAAAHPELDLEERKIISGMLNAYKVIENNLPEYSLLASLLDKVNLSSPHLRTCNACRNYLVFDTEGRIGKCHMQMDNPVTDICSVHPLNDIQDEADIFQNISVEDRQECKNCKWKYWCTSGCPYATYRATGRYDGKSPNCEIYKALLPEAVKLEGLRLLKYSC